MSYAINESGGFRAVDDAADLLPGEQFSLHAPAPAKPDIAKIETLARLAAIDAETLRPLRAVYAGTDTSSDHEKLAALEEEAQRLRAQL